MPRKGSWLKEDYRGRCPLHLAYRDNEIMCKSHLPGSTACIHHYADPEDSKTQQELYCNANYQRCEHYLSWKHFVWEDEDE